MCIPCDKNVLSFYPNFVKCRFKNMFLKESLTRFFYGDLVYKLRRVKCEENVVSSRSQIVKRLRRRKYDLEIIERTIGIVFGTSTALFRSFLKNCTLINKAVGTILRNLSKPLQRRQGPYCLPLLLIVGTPSVLGPEFASRRAEHSLRMSLSLYIFDILILSPCMSM